MFSKVCLPWWFHASMPWSGQAIAQSVQPVQSSSEPVKTT